MAKKDEVEADEFDEDLTALAVEAAARKKKMLLFGAIGVVLLLAASGGTWVALRSLSGGGEKTAPEAAKADEHAPAKADKNAKPAHNDAQYVVFDPAFLANYDVAGKQHYLQLSVAVMVRDEAAVTAVNTHMPLLRNRIVMLLSGEVFDQLQTDEGRVQLQKKLSEAIQEILNKETGKTQIEQVFFNNFVMQ